MPDTFLSLSVLIFILLPGVVFAVQIDNRRPTRDLSPLRELAVVAGIGTLCDLIVLIAFGILRVLLPNRNVGYFIKFGFSYIKLHYISVGWWVAGLLIISSCLAYILGRYMPAVAGRVASGSIKFTSAWWDLFHMHPETRIYVGCELQDGSYVAGYLLTYSTEVDETPDREITLSAPICYRPAGIDETSTLENVGAVAVNAGQLKFLTVAYQSVDDDG
jgi:hypothetical protein